MSSRGKRGRGRPPKTWSLSSRSHFLKVKKPKSFARGPQSDFGENAISGSGSSSPIPTSGLRLDTRGRSREAARKSRSFIHKVLSNVQDVGGAWEDDASGYSASDFEGEVDDNASDDSNETFDDTASTWSETSYSTIGSTPGRRRYFPKRSRTPELIDQKDVPPLTLLPSATDLVINSENLLQALSVYEVLRHFRSTLRLSPFRFEDFCVALTSDEQCCLLSETHIMLLKAMLREEDGNNTIFGPHDLKDSINVCLHFLDSMTWYELIRTYLDSDRTPEYRSSLSCLDKSDYCSLTVGEKLNILQTMTDLFLGTNAIREEIMSEGNIHYDDHCRSCHRLGDLLCCEMCPAVYHLGCVVPPLEEVPENDWLCSVCRAHQVKGVCECISEVEKSGLLCRQDPLGVDRHQRKYWFLCRHIVVEGDSEVWYYSSKVQLNELIRSLDNEHWERDLVRAIVEMKDDIIRQMALTEALTHELKGHKRAVLDIESAALLKLQSERLLRQAEEAERKAREAEEGTQQEYREEDRESSGTKTQTEKAAILASSTESLTTVTLTTTVTSASVTSMPNDTTASSVHLEQVTQSVSITAMSTTTKVVVTDSKDGNLGKDVSGRDVGDKDVGDKDVGDKVAGNAAEEGQDLLELARLEEERVKQEEEEEGKKEEQAEGDGKKVETSQSSETNLSDSSVAMETTEEPTTGAENKVATVQTKVVHVPSLLPNVKATVLQPGASELANSHDGDGKGVSKLSVVQEKGAGDGDGGTRTVKDSHSKTTVETRRIITRSKTGSLTPKHFIDSVTKSVIKTSKTNSDDSMVVINRDGDMTRVTRSRSSAGVVSHQVAHYRLGMENSYRSYENQYTTNTLALNKHQHNEERVKRQHLSHKFSLTPLSEFKWNGNIYGNKATVTATLRLSLTQLENAVPSPFLHPNWSLHRLNWLKAVHLCSKPRGFALVLLTLESCIKPVLFNHVWHDTLGHTRLQRITVIEREEMKKREKETRRRKDDEEEVANVWVKYTLGLKHQVWKQKGEEYRIAGNGGWMWVSQTRRCLSISQDKVGLRAVAAKLQADRTKSMSSDVKLGSSNSGEKEGDVSEDVVKMDVDEAEVESGSGVATRQVSAVNDEGAKSDCSGECEPMLTEPSIVKSEIDDTASVHVKKELNKVDLINVSGELVTRGQYPCVVKPHSRLDGLLEKRLRQHEVEMKNKTLLTQALAKYRAQELHKGAAPMKIEADHFTPDNKLAVVKGGWGYFCYSLLCRGGAFSNGQCYSVTCTRHTNHSHNATVRSQSTTGAGLDVEKSNSEGCLPNGLDSSSSEMGNCITEMKGRQLNCGKAAVMKSGDSNCVVMKSGDSNCTDTIMVSTTGMNSSVSLDTDSKHLLTLPGSDSTTSVESSDTKSSVLTTLVSSETKGSVSTSALSGDTKDSLSISAWNGDTRDSVLTNVESNDTNCSMSTSVVNSDSKCSVSTTQVSSDTKASVSTTLVSSVTKGSVLTNVRSNVMKGSVSISERSRISKGSVSTSVGSSVTKGTVSNTVISMQSLIQGGKIHLTPDSVTELESKLANIGCTRFKTSIGRFARSGRKSLAGRYVLRKGGIPNVHKFMTRSRCSSLFCLDHFQTRRLARFGGRRETPGFNYNCKMNNVYWPYPCPRTLFKTAWRYRTHCVKSLAAAALQLRVLWACMRWDDLAQKPPAGGTNTVTTETDIVTKELLKRREIGPYGLQSEFLVRKIIVPIGVTSQPKEKYTPQRSGLRERRRAESPTQREPSIVEKWTPEEELELWEIKLFAEKVEKQKAAQQEKAAVSASSVASTPHKATVTTSTKTPSTKLELEEQLKQQRQAMQQRRLLDTGRFGTASHRPLSTALRVITTTGNVGTSSTIVRVTPVTPGSSTRIVSQNSGIHRLSTSSQPLSSSISIRPRSILSAGHVQGSPKVVKPLTTIRPAKLQVKGGTTSTAGPSATNTQATVQSLRIIQDQSGQMHVHGLLPGQQIVRLADGRLQLLTTSTTATQQKQPAAVVAPVAVAPVAVAPVAQPLKIAVSQTQQQAVALQVAPSVAIKNNMTPQKVPQQPLLQAVRLPSGQVQIRPLVSGGRTTGASSVTMPKLTLMTPGVTPNLRIATTPVMSHGTVMPRTVLTVATSGRAITPQLLHAANVPSKPSQTSPVTSTAGVTLVRTPSGQPILLKSAVPAAAAVTSSVAVTPGSVLAAQTSPASSGKYTVTPQVVQQVVRQAMLQTNDPEIQAKLSAMQKQMTLESATPESSRSTTQQLMAVLQQQRQQQQQGHTDVTKVKLKVVTQEQRENRARMLVCTQVVKSMVERVEREERHEEKRLRRLETADEKQRLVVEQQHQQLLLRHKEQLKRDMLRKRALLEKALATHIQSEISAVLQQPPPPPSQKTTTKRHSEVLSTSVPVRLPQVTALTTDATTNKHLTTGVAKKRKLISTGGKHSSNKLYCVCRTPYDETKFYIGCDLCSNWFHGACVGIDETKARRIDTYVCEECQRQKTDTSEELYCICQTPYDDTQFYIGCDRCQDWFHGLCVGVSKAEADHMDSYVCPNCRRAGRDDDDISHQQLLVGRSWDQLQQLVRSLKSHKMSWPFLDAVDPKEVPEYYRVIKEPMDLTTVERKVAQRQYVKLGDFVKDVMRVFDNCRHFNSSDTPYYQCAEVLENFFVQKLKNFKDTS